MAETVALRLLVRFGHIEWRLFHIVTAMGAGAVLSFLGNLLELAFTRRSGAPAGTAV